MADLQFRDSFGFLVTDVARLLRKTFDRRVKGMGFTRAQWAVIAQLARSEGISQAALADLLDVEPVSLVPILDKLQQAGFVERRPDPNDRRANQLFLTDDARPHLNALSDIGQGMRDEMMDGLTADQRQQLIDMLLVVKGNLTNKSVDDLRKAVGHE